MPYLLALLTGIGVVHFGYLATAEGMILSFVKEYCTRLSVKIWRKEAAVFIQDKSDLSGVGWLRKIIWACPYCMCNPLTWGGLAYFLSVHNGFLEFNVITWISYCVVLSGLMKFIDLTAERMGVNFGG